MAIQKCTNRVRQLRRNRGMTQRDLANAVGVTRQTVIAIERGNYTPSVALALRIAHTFQTTCDDVFTLC